jgi:transposase-like protein
LQHFLNAMPASSAHTFRSWDDYLDKHRLEPTHHFAERTIRIHVWTAQEKFNAVVESTGMNEAEPAEYCRRKGLYPEQLARWRRACETANDWDREVNGRLKSEQKADRKRIRRLERELHGKDKAPAEAAALTVLRKKSRGDLGGGARG